MMELYTKDMRMLEYGLAKSYPDIFLFPQPAMADIVKEIMLLSIATGIVEITKIM